MIRRQCAREKIEQLSNTRMKYPTPSSSTPLLAMEIGGSKCKNKTQTISHFRNPLRNNPKAKSPRCILLTHCFVNAKFDHAARTRNGAIMNLRWRRVLYILIGRVFTYTNQIIDNAVPTDVLRKAVMSCMYKRCHS